MIGTTETGGRSEIASETVFCAAPQDIWHATARGRKGAEARDTTVRHRVSF